MFPVLLFPFLPFLAKWFSSVFLFLFSQFLRYFVVICSVFCHALQGRTGFSQLMNGSVSNDSSSLLSYDIFFIFAYKSIQSTFISALYTENSGRFDRLRLAKDMQ